LSNVHVSKVKENADSVNCPENVANRQPNLIEIHGIGSGKLRDEIHEIVIYYKEVESFVNQYHPNFGYGATEIYFGY
jgi:dsDNA-specific endonuclease/ATPase MutS2